MSSQVDVISASFYTNYITSHLFKATTVRIGITVLLLRNLAISVSILNATC